MRIGLIGDVHGEDRRLEQVLDTLAEMRLDTTLCVGDIADGPGDVDRCVRLLRERDVRCVKGNHDRWLLEDPVRGGVGVTERDSLLPDTLGWLTNLPRTLDIETPFGLLLLCHGLGDNDMRKLNQDDFEFPYTLENNLELQGILRQRRYAFVVAGHTHAWMCREYAGITFVNAGTLKQEHNPGFAVLDTGSRKTAWFDLAA